MTTSNWPIKGVQRECLPITATAFPRVHCTIDVPIRPIWSIRNPSDFVVKAQLGCKVHGPTDQNNICREGAVLQYHVLPRQEAKLVKFVKQNCPLHRKKIGKELEGMTCNYGIPLGRKSMSNIVQRSLRLVKRKDAQTFWLPRAHTRKPDFEILLVIRTHGCDLLKARHIPSKFVLP